MVLHQEFHCVVSELKIKRYVSQRQKVLHKKGHVLGLIFKIGAMSSDFCWDNTALEAHVLALEKPLPYVCLQKMMLMYVIIWESGITMDTVFAIAVQMYCSQHSL